jgi:hypothetical protein
MLAADVIVDFLAPGEKEWSLPGQSLSSGWTSLPAHPRNNGPAGANEVFVDGSVSWCQPAGMRCYYSYSAGSRYFYFYQEDLGPAQPVASAFSAFPK